MEKEKIITIDNKNIQKEYANDFKNISNVVKLNIGIKIDKDDPVMTSCIVINESNKKFLNILEPKLYNFLKQYSYYNDKLIENFNKGSNEIILNLGKNLEKTIDDISEKYNNMTSDIINSIKEHNKKVDEFNDLIHDIDSYIKIKTEQEMMYNVEIVIDKLCKDFNNIIIDSITSIPFLLALIISLTFIITR